MAEYKTEVTLRGAYTVDQRVLRDIFERARTFLESELTVRVKFTGGHQLETNSVEAACADSLARMHLIEEIVLEGL